MSALTPEATSINLKDEGNAKLKISRYAEACTLYTEAIELFPTAVLYSNRAMAFIKMEQYGVAITDADAGELKNRHTSALLPHGLGARRSRPLLTHVARSHTRSHIAAITLDPAYIKAYYRRGSANFALGKNKAALKDFKHVCKLKPKDPDARNKMTCAKKAVTEAAFAEAIYSDATAPLSDTIEPMGFSIDTSYDGPHPDPSGALTDSDAEELLFQPGMLPREFVTQSVEYFKSQKLIHKRYVARLLVAAKRYHEKLSSLTELTVPAENEEGGEGRITVCGDTHGQFYDVLNVFETNGYPSAKNPYVFNGDFVDRGSFGVEVILTYLLFKLNDPTSIYLSRGNHETKNMNKIYGFEGEVKHKYDMNIFNLFLEVFQVRRKACTEAL